MHQKPDQLHESIVTPDLTSEIAQPVPTLTSPLRAAQSRVDGQPILPAVVEERSPLQAAHNYINYWVWRTGLTPPPAHMGDKDSLAHHLNPAWRVHPAGVNLASVIANLRLQNRHYYQSEINFFEELNRLQNQVGDWERSVTLYAIEYEQAYHAALGLVYDPCLPLVTDFHSALSRDPDDIVNAYLILSRESGYFRGKHRGITFAFALFEHLIRQNGLRVEDILPANVETHASYSRPAINSDHS